MSSDLKYVDTYKQYINKYINNDNKLTPGFSINERNRPLIISKLESYFREKIITVRSLRTLNELKTFVWRSGRAEAMKNHNDDLVIALGTALS